MNQEKIEKTMNQRSKSEARENHQSQEDFAKCHECAALDPDEPNEQIFASGRFQRRKRARVYKHTRGAKKSLYGAIWRNEGHICGGLDADSITEILNPSISRGLEGSGNGSSSGWSRPSPVAKNIPATGEGKRREKREYPAVFLHFPV